ncbi:MAG: sigma-70 family RNA polymerase sigma factor [Pirellulaceae bacterium]|jgi:RNA polymerase sigma-70 factor (ECF subfamily)|nr:sigma-70 family RNA polymerase sigma factor [Pirellulaceae bacterium]
MWPESEKTEELLGDAREGKAEAVNKLIDRHRDAILRLVRMRLDRRIQPRVGVSDVVQDVFIEANRRLQKYLQDPVMPFHLWLRQIAKDRIIDAHRRHRVSKKRSVDREQPAHVPADMDHSSMALANQLVDGEVTPMAAATQRELAVRVEQTIGELPEQDRDILLMRHYEFLSNQEVAEALGLSQPAASMRYLRAIRRMRELLVVEEEDSP